MACMSRLTQSRSLSTVMGRPERRRKNGVNRNTPWPWAVARRSRSRVARLPQSHFATCEPRFIRSTLLLGRHRPLCTAPLEPPARLLQHSTDTSNACRNRFRRADPEDCGRPRRRPPVSRRARTGARRSEQRLASVALLTGGSRAEAPREQLSLSLLPGTPVISYRLRRRHSYL